MTAWARLLIVVMASLVLAAALCALDGDGGVDPCSVSLVVTLAVTALVSLARAGTVLPLAIEPVRLVPRRAPRPPI